MKIKKFRQKYPSKYFGREGELGVEVVRQCDTDPWDTADDDNSKVTADNGWSIDLPCADWIEPEDIMGLVQALAEAHAYCLEKK
jgi:hypothetical protein